jgi:hypothetical protein
MAKNNAAALETPTYIGLIAIPAISAFTTRAKSAGASSN